MLLFHMPTSHYTSRNYPAHVLGGQMTCLHLFVFHLEATAGMFHDPRLPGATSVTVIYHFSALLLTCNAAEEQQSPGKQNICSGKEVTLLPSPH